MEVRDGRYYNSRKRSGRNVGCGKTTLLRHMKVDYLPAGVRSENTRIYLNGTRIEQLSQRESAGIVGYVRQNPESAQVMDRVWHELAFGLESLGYTQEVMQRKVAEMVAFFGLEGIYEEKLCNLSGGQKQLVNLAAVMVMEPEVLVLDEPTSQLDPVAAAEFFHIVERIHRELGTTVIMTEHRLEDVYSMCDRVWLMSDGRIECEGTPEQIAMYLSDRKHVMYSALPSAARMLFWSAAAFPGAAPSEFRVLFCSGYSTKQPKSTRRKPQR